MTVTYRNLNWIVLELVTALNGQTPELEIGDIIPENLDLLYMSLAQMREVEIDI